MTNMTNMTNMTPNVQHLSNQPTIAIINIPNQNTREANGRIC